MIPTNKYLSKEASLNIKMRDKAAAYKSNWRLLKKMKCTPAKERQLALDDEAKAQLSA